MLAKNEEIKKIEEKYKKYDQFLVNKTKDKILKTIRKSKIVQKLEFYVSHPFQLPSKGDWELLDQLFHDTHPNFPATLQDSFDLSVNEYRVCQLVFAGISPKGISVLMGFDKSNVTNIRKRLLTKLTGKNGKAGEFDQYLFNIPIV